MKKIITKILTVILIAGIPTLLWHCGSQESPDKAEDRPAADSLQQQATDQPPAEVKAGQIIQIRGNNVNMRTQPRIGDNVIMQLSTGDSVEVLYRGPKEEISHMVDYWYKVMYNNREMWVYGGVTSVRAEGLQPEEGAQSERKKEVAGTFNQILESGNNHFFLMNDQEGRLHRFLIVDSYEGEQMFSSRPEDLKGLGIKVTWDHPEPEALEGPTEENRQVIRVELD